MERSHAFRCSEDTRYACVCVCVYFVVCMCCVCMICAALYIIQCGGMQWHQLTYLCNHCHQPFVVICW